MKTHKAVSERFKVTKSKKAKVIKRAAGQDHFNSRDTGKVTRKKRRDRQMAKPMVKALKTMINK